MEKIDDQKTIDPTSTPIDQVFSNDQGETNHKLNGIKNQTSKQASSPLWQRIVVGTACTLLTAALGAGIAIVAMVFLLEVPIILWIVVVVALGSASLAAGAVILWNVCSQKNDSKDPAPPPEIALQGNEEPTGPNRSNETQSSPTPLIVDSTSLTIKEILKNIPKHNKSLPNPIKIKEISAVKTETEFDESSTTASSSGKTEPTNLSSRILQNQENLDEIQQEANRHERKNNKTDSGSTHEESSNKTISVIKTSQNEMIISETGTKFDEPPMIESSSEKTEATNLSSQIPQNQENPNKETETPTDSKHASVSSSTHDSESGTSQNEMIIPETETEFDEPTMTESSSEKTEAMTKAISSPVQLGAAIVVLGDKRIPFLYLDEDFWNQFNKDIGPVKGLILNGLIDESLINNSYTTNVVGNFEALGKVFSIVQATASAVIESIKRLQYDDSNLDLCELESRMENLSERMSTLTDDLTNPHNLSVFNTHAIRFNTLCTDIYYFNNVLEEISAHFEDAKKLATEINDQLTKYQLWLNTYSTQTGTDKKKDPSPVQPGGTVVSLCKKKIPSPCLDEGFWKQFNASLSAIKKLIESALIDENLVDASYSSNVGENFNALEAGLNNLKIDVNKFTEYVNKSTNNYRTETDKVVVHMKNLRGRMSTLNDELTNLHGWSDFNAHAIRFNTLCIDFYCFKNTFEEIRSKSRNLADLEYLINVQVKSYEQWLNFRSKAVVLGGKQISSLNLGEDFWNQFNCDTTDNKMSTLNALIDEKSIDESLEAPTDCMGNYAHKAKTNSQGLNEFITSITGKFLESMKGRTKLTDIHKSILQNQIATRGETLSKSKLDLDNNLTSWEPKDKQKPSSSFGLESIGAINNHATQFNALCIDAYYLAKTVDEIENSIGDGNLTNEKIQLVDSLFRKYDRFVTTMTKNNPNLFTSNASLWGKIANSAKSLLSWI
jgi:hypothetical protein